MICWQILIIIYFMTHLLGVILLSIFEDEFGVTFISPYTLYKYCKVNVFGAIFLYLLYLAFTPIYALIGLFIWLFTVGRR